MSHFDVFLSHNSKDKALAAEIQAKLRSFEVSSFLDKWNLLPGQSWLENIEAAFNCSSACAVLLGAHGIGLTQKAEIEIALIRQLAEPNFPVIPVLLPGATEGALSRLLSRNTWVDFRQGVDDEECMKMLVAGIKGDERILNDLHKFSAELKPLITSNRAIQMSLEDMKMAFLVASGYLLKWPATLSDGRWLERNELSEIKTTIEKEQTSTTLLLGPPGSGKSALLSRLGQLLLGEGKNLLAIKADSLPSELQNIDDLTKELKLAADLSQCIEIVSKKEPIVILIDQLDAIADMVDLHSNRLNVLLDLIHSVSDLPNVHIVTSCRTFEHRHDPRLRNLEAEVLSLELPSVAAVTSLLEERGISTTGWPGDVIDMLRTPQHLKIFLDFCTEGRDPEIFHSYHAMLDRLWEEKVLGRGREYTNFIEEIASEMGEREDLWLPLARYENYLHLITYLEADGIVARDPEGRRIGFLHQTLFEYARARSFVRKEGSLSEYVFKRQNGLFVRPQLWNALNYLRSADESSYKEEFGVLWSHKELRSHLRNMLIEFLGQVSDPKDYEARWLLPFLNEPKYRRRILICMNGSTGWFENIKETYIPMFMSEEPMKAWDIVFLLASALSFDKEMVLNLIETYWSKKVLYDALTLHVLNNLKEWDNRSLDITCAILRRSDIADHIFDSLSTLVSEYAPEMAPRVVRAYLDRLTEIAREETLKKTPSLAPDATEEEKIIHSMTNDPLKPYKSLLESSTEFHNLPEIAEAAPLSYLQAMWPWFLNVIELITRESHPILDSFREDSCLATNLSEDVHLRREYPLLQSIESAISKLAQDDTENFFKFLEEWKSKDVLVIQRLLARGLSTLAAKYPMKVLDFLAEDNRRLVLGGYQDRHSDTKKLIRAIVPHLDKSSALKLETLIVEFKMYKESYQEESPSVRLDRIKWNREHRLRLLKSFPVSHMTQKTRYLLAEEERAFPQLDDHDIRFSGVQFIGSPMSVEQMRKAKDEEILGLLKELNDATGWDHPRFHMKGGTIQASREIEELAKKDPERLSKLILKFKPKENEIAAAHALEGLGKSNLPISDLFALIRRLSESGFDSDDFQHSAAKAIGARLSSSTILPDDLFDLIESWLKDSPEDKSRKKEEPANDDPKQVRSILWSYGGFMVLPHGNYPLIETLSRACLILDPPDIDRWLSVLERHLGRNENPQVWSAIATFYLPNLQFGDRERAGLFINNLFRKYPEVINSLEGALLIAKAQSWVNETLIKEWFNFLKNSGWEHGPQAYAEILLLRFAWFPDAEWIKDEINQILEGSSESSRQVRSMRIGLAFSAAELWSEPAYRILAGDILLSLISDSDEGVLSAFSHVFKHNRSFFPDKYTFKILDSLCKYPRVLGFPPGEYFFEQLEDLLTTDPDRIYGVCNAFIDEMIKHAPDRYRTSLGSEAMINIALTLQRLGGTHREMGLTLFEKLLELDAYSAIQTLVEIDRRPGQITARPLRRRRRKRK